tara:strand:- start:391 stop:876 length:486 start_codon:yes stop_codon:yes gene_type:complete
MALVVDGTTLNLGDNTPMVVVSQGGAQTTTDATATLVAMSTVHVDTDSAFTNTSGNYKFTVPSGKAGTYAINWMVTTFNENSNTKTIQAYIYKNGSTLAFQRLRDDDPHHRFMNCKVHFVGDLAVGDVIQFYILHDVTSDVPQILGGNSQSQASIMRVKPA